MTALTHAVFDATTGEQVGDPYPNAASALAAASALGGPARGYVVGPLKWKPPPATLGPSSAPEATQPKPEAPRAAVATDPEGPGLFD